MTYVDRIPDTMKELWKRTEGICLLFYDDPDLGYRPISAQKITGGIDINLTFDNEDWDRILKTV